MADTIEHFIRSGSFRESWRDRFQNKWPAMTMMMMKTESEIDYPNITPCPDFGIKNPSIKSWPSSSNQDTWADTRVSDHDMTDEESSSRTTKKSKKRSRTCSCVLCVFLVLSTLAAAFAGIGLSILLTQPQFGVTGKTRDIEDSQIDVGFNENEQAVLTDKFCDLVKTLLKDAHFPVERGIENCESVLRLMKGSEKLEIEIQIQPADGYTLKEKFLRALTDLVQDRKLSGDTKLNISQNSTKSDSGVIFPKTGGFFTFNPEVADGKDVNKSDKSDDLVNSESSYSNSTVIDVISSSTKSSGLLINTTDSPYPELNDDTTNATINRSAMLNGTVTSSSKTENPESHSELNITDVPNMHIEHTTSIPSLSTINDTVVVDTSTVTKQPTTPGGSHTPALTHDHTDTFVKTVPMVSVLNTDDIITTTDSVSTASVDTTDELSPLDRDLSSNTHPIPTVTDAIIKHSIPVNESTTISNADITAEAKKSSFGIPIKTVQLFEVDAMGNGSDSVSLNGLENKTNSVKDDKDFVAESLMSGGVFKLPMRTTSNFKLFLFSSGTANKMLSGEEKSKSRPVVVVRNKDSKNDETKKKSKI